MPRAGDAHPVRPAGVPRTGRQQKLLWGCFTQYPAGTGLPAVPLFGLLRDPGTSGMVRGAAACAAGAEVGRPAGPRPALPCPALPCPAELFPARVRRTGPGLAHSLSNAVFSGPAGLIITEAVRRTGDLDVPARHAAAACALSVPALPGRPSGKAG